MEYGGLITAAGDEELLGLVASGDEGALGALIDRHRRRVRAILMRGLKSREDAEEAAQDVFLRIGRSAGRFEAGRAFLPWLTTITKNVLRDRLRRLRPRVLPLAEDLYEGLAVYDQGVVADEVREALGALPECYRAALVLRYFAELSYREAAQQIGLTEKGFETRLARAKVRLRRALLRGRARDGV